jgi:hypothetical protein
VEVINKYYVLITSDRVNKMKLFKLIVHHKNFSGWYPKIHNSHFLITY